MMSKNKTYYICNDCGYKSGKWMGRCPNCGSWNSFIEEKEDLLNSEELLLKVIPSPVTMIKSDHQPRFSSGINELDRVLGGGVVNGSLVLLGGAPGIGKSTLVLQVASLFSNRYGKVLYISGEESQKQIKLRAERLNTLNDNLYVLAETEFDQIEALLYKENFKLIIIDSIQTIYDPRIDSTPGSVSQVKGISNKLLNIAKNKEVAIFLIGHVTKEGILAGPRVLEHLVDTVLYFEGDRNYSYRILRAVKNRFGSTNEVGVFEMKSTGMKEVLNPSQLFLEERPQGASGSVIVPVIEGTRSILVELQALVTSAAFGNPLRLTMGMDHRRVSILLAVLEKKAGFSFQTRDVHLNIVGGLKIDEPALDLGILVAIISSYQDRTLPPNIAVVGEVGLAGEIRGVNQIEKRLRELMKLGFNKLIIPKGNLRGLDFKSEIELVAVENIHDILTHLFS
jgi:DNA repair protein RadA/Sms